MGRFEWRPDWVEIIGEQEQILRYESFSRKTALELGLQIIKLAEENGWGNAAVRIIEDNATVFAYKMPGTSE